MEAPLPVQDTVTLNRPTDNIMGAAGAGMIKVEINRSHFLFACHAFSFDFLSTEKGGRNGY